MVSQQVDKRTRREQVNLVLQADSPLARHLREAEEETGQPRTQIVREIVEAFLETWKRAELAKQSLLNVPTTPTVLPLTRLMPRVRHGYTSEPGLAEVVATRRPVPERGVGPPVSAQVGQSVRLTPRVRPTSPRARSRAGVVAPGVWDEAE
jgi:predicted DNA-binding protein